MKVYLLQHGEAMPKEKDLRRPLSYKGIEEIRKVIAFLAKNIDLSQTVNVYHSGKLRAQQTADAFAGELSLAPPLEIAGLLPLDDPQIWASRLNASDEDTMLVGHLPHLARLAALLISGDQEKEILRFRMGGVAALERNESGWWSVSWMVIPGLFKESAGEDDELDMEDLEFISRLTI
ncbi:MAG: phosphohistidine phosphatase SixA [Proteobacteria bacterium]|nr:phosphohistidine phosphatase SixA [Pseudomonadota bacterium]MBU1708402.1 phosphohistidine phosphatase SixA [Pseudomonadota bacterium]